MVNRFRKFRRCIAFVGCGLLLAAPLVFAQGSKASWAQDVVGGEDHPLISRYNDSWLMAYQRIGFDATSFPGKLGIGDKLEFLAPVAVEGRITRLVYFAPPGKTPLEVHRNYLQALTGAGFKVLLDCTPKIAECEKMHYGFGRRYDNMKEADFRANEDRQKNPALKERMRSLGGSNMLGADDFYFTYFTMTRKGTPVHVMVSTGKVYDKEITTTYIEIAEPEAMKSGEVTVNADALKSGLKADGKIALYGIYFDTAKTDVKPESKPQLDEIAKLLKGQPDLKITLVGHTDNQGGVDANLALSQRRAQAVSEALIKGYQIDARRFSARGVASLAPVASNATEDGRARNRRVELVLP